MAKTGPFPSTPTSTLESGRWDWFIYGVQLPHGLSPYLFLGHFASWWFLFEAAVNSAKLLWFNWSQMTVIRDVKKIVVNCMDSACCRWTLRWCAYRYILQFSLIGRVGTAMYMSVVISHVVLNKALALPEHAHFLHPAEHKHISIACACHFQVSPQPMIRTKTLSVTVYVYLMCFSTIMKFLKKI